jgi:hypothetical protein
MRIFMEGQEEWIEPTGEVMILLARLFAAGALIAFLWAASIRIAGHPVAGGTAWSHGPSLAALVLLLLSVAFWLAGKLSVFVGRKMREKGIKLP